MLRQNSVKLVYQNIKDHPIALRGIGIFRSVLDYYVVGYTTIKVFVNKKVIML